MPVLSMSAYTVTWIHICIRVIDELGIFSITNMLENSLGGEKHACLDVVAFDRKPEHRLELLNIGKINGYGGFIDEHG